MVSQVEVALDTINIYLISDIIDLISSDSLKDKRFKFSIMTLKGWTSYKNLYQIDQNQLFRPSKLKILSP